MARKKDTDPQEFWKDYEAALGEKVLSFSLGQYLSGWAEYDPPLWGLLIATDRGFRFHHFPHEGWLQALARLSTGGKAPTEKTIFISRERILRAELRRERSLLKRIFFASRPRFIIRYRDGDGAEEEFVAEADSTATAVLENLQPWGSRRGLAEELEAPSRRSRIRKEPERVFAVNFSFMRVVQKLDLCDNPVGCHTSSRHGAHNLMILPLVRTSAP
jgi:hypothetical protein